MAQTLEFDDILIKPVPSDVSSRDDVDISVKLSDSLTLNFPLIASPMVGIVDGKFAHLLSDLGGLAIMHRFYKSREQLFKDIEDNVEYWIDNYGISIRIDENGLSEYFDYNPKIILIDTANGYTEKLLKYCEEVKGYIVRKNQDILLMAGNVVTAIGCDRLRNAGVDIIRVGIGGGSPCSTRNQTGIGLPNITALEHCNSGSGDFMIVMDGGIKNSGDFVKSIVAGADLGMAGKLYAECYEAPCDGWLYGMSSRTHMENENIEIKSVEGFDTPIEKKYSLEQFVREFGYGIKSAGTYLNACTLHEIYANGDYVIVTDHAIKKGL